MTVPETHVRSLALPRLRQRGSIEALRLSVSQIDIVAFPRSNERGLIDGQAWDAMRREVAQVIATLKAERERQNDGDRALPSLACPKRGLLLLNDPKVLCPRVAPCGIPA